MSRLATRWMLAANEASEPDPDVLAVKPSFDALLRFDSEVLE